MQKALKMTKYILSSDNSNQQYIHFKVVFEQIQKDELIYLPKWRPGRYELGNFAKNVRNFKVYDAKGKPVKVEKIDTSSWRLLDTIDGEIRVEYGYYATELNAGSTFLSNELLYVNPVNCFIYTNSSKDKPCTVELPTPKDWALATSLEKDGNKLFAEAYDELADSPFMCSKAIQYNQYEVNGTMFHLWFQGLCQIPWEKVIKDFKAFTAKQIEKFIEFPTPHYHFLFLIHPTDAYHGVEHAKSTVISLGPTTDLFSTLYTELLGVSSHELYHTWNVKLIRPIEMFPYNYQQENFSRMGFLYEGVTTYMGDLMLLKAGVFDLKQYLKEFTAQLQKHFDNQGRFYYSVADSSFDTWLDGYVSGAPGRKVSIYTEGCLLAFVCDIKIRANSNNKHGLDELMKRLYFNFALQNKGVSEQDFQDLLVELMGEEAKELLQDYFYGTRPFEAILTDALETIGMELTQKPHSSYAAGRMGFKYVNSKTGNSTVTALYPGSPADLAGLMLDDEVIAINDYKVDSNMDKWLTFFDDSNKKVTVFRKGKLIELHFPEVQRNFFLTYGVKMLDNPNSFQAKAFEFWSK